MKKIITILSLVLFIPFVSFASSWTVATWTWENKQQVIKQSVVQTEVFNKNEFISKINEKKWEFFSLLQDWKEKDFFIIKDSDKFAKQKRNIIKVLTKSRKDEISTEKEKTENEIIEEIKPKEDNPIKEILNKKRNIRDELVFEKKNNNKEEIKKLETELWNITKSIWLLKWLISKAQLDVVANQKKEKKIKDTELIKNIEDKSKAISLLEKENETLKASIESAENKIKNLSIVNYQKNFYLQKLLEIEDKNDKKEKEIVIKTLKFFWLFLSIILLINLLKWIILRKIYNNNFKISNYSQIISSYSVLAVLIWLIATIWHLYSSVLFQILLFGSVFIWLSRTLILSFIWNFILLRKLSFWHKINRNLEKWIVHDIWLLNTTLFLVDNYWNYLNKTIVIPNYKLIENWFAVNKKDDELIEINFKYHSA